MDDPAQTEPQAPKRGRPTKYTKEAIDKISEALRAGNTRNAAAAYGGIAASTLEAWVRLYPDFRDLVITSEAMAEIGYVAVIAKAAQAGDWRAAAFYLERRHHEDWGRKDRIDLIDAIRRLLEQDGVLSDDEVTVAMQEAEAVLARRPRR